MATLLEVSLDTLSQATDFANELAAASELVRRWNEIIGDATTDEQDLMADSAGFVVYAYAIVINAIRTEPNPGTKTALGNSRKALLDAM
jgi:hypothetical protein